MSDLLNSASLVMIPSGYAEDKVYSVVPSDGSGDLSFTRASNGTRINSAGLVEVCPWNLVQYSEEFNNAIYTVKNAVTIVDNSTTAPNGTSTADLIYPNSSGTFRYVAQIFTQSTNIYTTSIYAKAQNKSVIWMYMDDSSSNGIVYFDLSDGTMSVTAGGYSTPVGTMTAVGNGWYRCTFTYGLANTLSSGSGFGVCDAKGSPYATASGTNGVYFWGYQLNIGATAKPYFPTTDRLNVPRLTYQNGGGGCPSLLLEKQSTNVVTYSQQINSANGYNLSNVTSSEDSLTSPDGTINADKIIESTSNSTHAVTFISSLGGTVDSSPYCISVFVKAEGRSQILFYDNNQAVGGVSYFNLSTGVVTSGTGKIENYGNGWYRCTIFCLKDNSTSANIQLYLLDSAGNQTYTGNGTSGIGLWGYQCEASSYPTSYIPTTSSSATRVADACSKTGISSLIGQTEGVIYIDVLASAQNVSGLTYGFFYLFGDSTNNIQLYYISGILYIYVVASSSVLINTSTSQTITANTRYKIAMAYKSGQYALYINGSQILVNTASAVPAMSQFNFNATGFGALAAETPNNYNEFILFPTRLTNAELASLTTI